MSNSRHVALVVEDDVGTREEIEEILRALDCEVVSCDNRQSALAHLARQTFCMTLLDLQIYAEPGSIKGHIEQGKSLLRDIRRLYPTHSGTSFYFPILIISGHAQEWPEAKEVMKDGASEFIRKPLTGEVSTAIRNLLQASGRADHNSCASAPAPSAPPAAALHLTIPGDRDRRRTRVLLGSRPVSLTDRSLRVLLHLVAGRLGGVPVHKNDLGAQDTQGFKGISVLREEMSPAFPPGVDSIIHNDHHGYYKLIPDVTIGDIIVQNLIEIGDAQITALVENIEKLRSAKSDGKL